MTVAVRTTTSLAATISQANLVAAIKTAMLNAGFTTLFDDYTATNRILVYEITVDSSKTYGKNYLWISITSTLVVSTQIYSTWNAVAHTGTSGSIANTFTAFVTGTAITFNSFNGGDEINLVIATQGSVIVVLGFLAPATRPNWWDLNSWNWGFIPSATNFSTWRSSGRNPYSNDSYAFYIVTAATLANANPANGKRDVITGLILANASNAGVAGKTSDDISVVAGNGTARYDLIQPSETVQQFCILSNAAGGFALRVN